jgi:hypothetical protein
MTDKSDALVSEYGRNAPDAAKFGVGATLPDQKSISPGVEQATAGRRLKSENPGGYDKP